MVFSYLVPKEEYKIYLQFFISIFIIVLLLKPVMEVFSIQEVENFYNTFEQFRYRVESLDLRVDEEADIFEYFFSKGKRE